MRKKHSIHGESRKHLTSFLETNAKGIVEAEIQSCKDVGFEAITSRVYVFTLFTMTMAAVSVTDPNDLYEIIGRILKQLEQEEPDKLDEEVLEMYQKHGFLVSAIITVLPGKALHLTGTQVNQIPDLDIRRRIIDGTITEEYLKQAHNGKYADLFVKSINIGYYGFDKCEAAIYNVIEKDGESTDVVLNRVVKQENMRDHRIHGFPVKINDYINVE